jgi:gluconolactonase
VFAVPPTIPTEIYATLPPHLMAKGSRRSFLEGPSFDRHGNLYLVDLVLSRILRLTPARQFEVVAEYSGEPNGLKIHKDGRIFIADHANGMLVLDPASGALTTFIDRPRRERFKGLNDLVFGSDGAIYFTDQGESSLADPTGRLWVLRADKRLHLLLDNIPSPNGLVLSLDEETIFVAATRANAIWRVPLLRERVGRVSNFIQLSGGSGPDGMAIDGDGNLLIAHPGLGAVWQFNRLGEPIGRIQSSTGLRTTNIAFGGEAGRTLFITESDTGQILRASLQTPGRPMYSHAPASASS